MRLCLPLRHPFTHSLIHLFTHSVIHLFTHSLIWSTEIQTLGTQCWVGFIKQSHDYLSTNLGWSLIKQPSGSWDHSLPAGGPTSALQPLLWGLVPQPFIWRSPPDGGSPGAGVGSCSSHTKGPFYGPGLSPSLAPTWHLRDTPAGGHAHLPQRFPFFQNHQGRIWQRLLCRSFFFWFVFSEDGEQSVPCPRNI